MADETTFSTASPTLEDWQHWTLVMGRAQQMMMEAWADSLKKDQPFPSWSPGAFGFAEQPGATDPMALMTAGALMLWLGVVLAGGVGAVLRFLVDRAVARRAARSLPFVGLPFGTLAVNTSGAALLGLLGSLALNRYTALLAGTAFVGSYTTFSTWMLETQRLSEERQEELAAEAMELYLWDRIGSDN